MIILSVLLAGLAALLSFDSPPGRALRRRLAPVDQGIVSGTRPGSWLPRVAPFLAAAAAPVVLGALDGRRGFWLGMPVAFAAATIWTLARAGAARRRALRARRQVAQACSVLATQVRIGQPPLVAVRSAAADCPVLRQAVTIVDLGGDPAVAWQRQAAVPGYQGLTELARAWQLATRTGADMADALDKVADGLFEDDAVGLVVASEAAGPRASGKIMAVLPLAGIGLGYAIGGDPVRFLTQTPYGWGCLIVGTGLACTGVLWMERVADRAAV